MLMTCGTIKQKAEGFFVTKGQSYKIEKNVFNSLAGEIQPKSLELPGF